MFSKKYFSISEVSKICLLPSHKLRYIDKTDKNISIVKIKGRRYYTQENIDYLTYKYSKQKLPNEHIGENSDARLVQQIDKLINDFNNLAKRLK